MKLLWRNRESTLEGRMTMKRVSMLVVLALGLVAGLGCSSSSDKGGAAGACACKAGCACGHCSGSAKDCTCKK